MPESRKPDFLKERLISLDYSGALIAPLIIEYNEEVTVPRVNQVESDLCAEFLVALLIQAVPLNESIRCGSGCDWHADPCAP